MDDSKENKAEIKEAEKHDPNTSPLMQLTVDELREQLRNRKLKVSGLKRDLVTRLECETPAAERLWLIFGHWWLIWRMSRYT